MLITIWLNWFKYIVKCLYKLVKPWSDFVDTQIFKNADLMVGLSGLRHFYNIYFGFEPYEPCNIAALRICSNLVQYRRSGNIGLTHVEICEMMFQRRFNGYGLVCNIWGCELTNWMQGHQTVVSLVNITLINLITSGAAAWNNNKCSFMVRLNSVHEYSVRNDSLTA